MRGCDQRTAYLDRRLSASQMAAFEQHAQTCTACQMALDDWRAIAEALRTSAWRASEAVALPATAGVVRRARLRPPEQPRVSRIWLTWLVVPAFAIALVIGAYLVRMRAQPATLFEANQVARLGHDAVRVDASGRVRVIEASSSRTVLRLERGSALFEVDATHGRRDFRVDVGEPLEVRVTGTRFTLTRTDGAVAVSVHEGSVVVLRRGEVVTAVSAGESRDVSRVDDTATDDERPAHDSDNEPAAPQHDARGVPSNNTAAHTTAAQQPPTREPRDARARVKKPQQGPVPEPQYDAWSDAASSGACKTVIPAMADRAVAADDDARTWSLLADCYRKEKAFAEADVAYRKVIAYGNARLAQRARYLAAEIELDALDDPKAAVPHLRAYIAAEERQDALDRAARLRLGRALMQLGEKASAREVLRELIERNDGAPESREAAGLLDEIR